MPFTNGGIDAFLNMALKQQSPEACEQRHAIESKRVSMIPTDHDRDDLEPDQCSR